MHLHTFLKSCKSPNPENRGSDKGNDGYILPGSFFIGILNYNRNNKPFFFSEEGWVNLQTKELVNKKDFKVFVELPKFNKKASECHIFRDKIIFLFKNLHILKERPSNFGEKIFDRIFSVTEVCKLKGDELKAYRYSMKYVDERKLEVRCAKKEAFLEGILETAKNMLKDGLSLTRVARITKLPKEQVLALK
ncbi:MAG: Rpn family recombination-promoting nuclease/putative transposase [Fibromonadales bacterium]|nr:Rpn family recombination-promoting nuclease/putative transposase [Fibromonadales bacterium]